MVSVQIAHYLDLFIELLDGLQAYCLPEVSVGSESSPHYMTQAWLCGSEIRFCLYNYERFIARPAWPGVCSRPAAGPGGENNFHLGSKSRTPRSTVSPPEGAGNAGFP